ncbi:MAG: hypothetical protein KDE26_03370 [Bacteroidetes bacterium]|nr:hypothetical protein [Bacteroidota bacterium]
MLGFVAIIMVSWPVRLVPPGTVLPEQISLYQIVDDDICLKVVRDSALYREGWDTLLQPVFWRRMMKIGPDTSIVNIAKTREIVGMIPTANWAYKSKKAKKAYEDSVRKTYGLKRKDEIFFTSGRSHFYQFEKVLRSVDKAIEVFTEEQTDPWYAQAILLIESPGRMQFSTDGAYGAFQLMEGVAKEVGLIINDTIDERQDFVKSAQGAARLINRVCIPHTRAICEKYNLSYNESDIWFRLLVMHVYHAGARNVARVIRKINPKEGGVQLIQEVWKTKSRRFGNASQNYSQITIASLLEFDELIQTQGIICPPKEELIP